MSEPPSTETRHQSGGLAVALASLDLDAITVADAVADVADTAGENVTTAIRADLKEFRAETLSRFETLRAETQSQFEKLGAETHGRSDTLAAHIEKFRAEAHGRSDTLAAHIEKFRAEAHGRSDTLANSIQSLQREMTGMRQSFQREISGMRWTIGIAFSLMTLFLATFLAISTFLRA